MSETGLLAMQLEEIMPIVEITLYCFCFFLAVGLLYVKIRK